MSEDGGSEPADRILMAFTVVLVTKEPTLDQENRVPAHHAEENFAVEV